MVAYEKHLVLPSIKIDPSEFPPKDLLEKLPHEKMKIVINRDWGRPELSTYLDGFLKDTRDNTRKGFPESVMTAITKLILINDTSIPDHLKPEDDPASAFAIKKWTLPKGF